jgi:hypothetical protein
MTTIKFTPAAAFGAAILMLTSCHETDVEAPTVCTSEDTANSVLVDEIEADAGTTLTIEDTFCDNEGLSEVRWDIHNAADHAHEEGEEEEGLILHSGTDWEFLELQSLDGQSATAAITLDIPLTSRGVWDVVVSLVDAEGNAAEDVVTQLHIENDHLPAFTLTTVNGTDPNGWDGEPVWAPGSSVAVSGSVADSDGVATASLELVEEASETVLWEMDLATGDAMEVVFDVQVDVPASVSGECHFEMKATDTLGNAMETGFHVEVE